MTANPSLAQNNTQDAPPPVSAPRVVIRIDEKRCKGCDICVKFCKQDCLALNGFVAIVTNANECTKCMRCEILCPDFAITVD